MEKLSKTQKKRQALSVQELGEKLVSLSDDQIAAIALPEDVLTAVAVAKKIKQRGGRKRQLQYIGALMRKIETAPIHVAVQNLKEGSRKQVEMHRQAEVWRDELVRGNTAVLNEIYNMLPAIDREQLTGLITKGRQEFLKKQSASAESRTLFRFLHKQIQQR